MSQLTAASPRAYEIGNQEFQDSPMVASAAIFEGSALSVQNSSGNTGYVHQLVASEDFAGFANTSVTDATGNNGGTTVNAITRGVVKLAVTGVTVASLGVEVYASDGNTFTTTSTSNTAIGKIVKWISSTTCLVYFTAKGYSSI